MTKQIIVGTRGSKLAMVQTESVVARIREANPGIDVTISRIATAGDHNYHVPLDRVASVGIFVKELEEALLDRRTDLAVHSLKDMPVDLPAGLGLAAVLERAYPGDVLITNGKKLAELPVGARIGTGSLRRAAELLTRRPDLKTVSIRGNVDTRVNKVINGELDGVILAAAGLKRLGWEEKITEYLPLENFLPAVGQGVIAIEARSDDKETARIVAPLNHPPTWYSMTAERAFLRTLSGGCQAPIGALATVTGDTLKIEGMVIDVKDNKMLRGTETGSVNQANELGTRLAKRLLAAGADKLLVGEDEDEDR
ncbi:MAG: hydroxymethylbilane synthase [Chloroflexi bacterium]|nr:hydroxymethylbilane synthase [Chloroflexota bacterium]